MDFLPKIVYQDNHLLLARKPHGIASSWGQEESFLDSIKKYGSDDRMRSYQISVFGEKGEYGLLNRLDNVTSWLLYFARSYEAKAEYMRLQEQWSITKTYYAQVYGTPRSQFGRITTPIYHHRDDASRMTLEQSQWRGVGQESHSYREMVEGTPRWEFARLKVVIQSGTRHQIRVHLASIGHPIVGDRLYMTQWLRKRYEISELSSKIELVSAGVYFC